MSGFIKYLSIMVRGKSGDILGVTNRGLGCYWHLGIEISNVAKHPTMSRTVPTTKTCQPQRTIARRWRNPGLALEKRSNSKATW